MLTWSGGGGWSQSGQEQQQQQVEQVEDPHGWAAGIPSTAQPGRTFLKYTGPLALRWTGDAQRWGVHFSVSLQENPAL